MAAPRTRTLPSTTAMGESETPVLHLPAAPHGTDPVQIGRSLAGAAAGVVTLLIALALLGGLLQLTGAVPG